MLLTKMGNFIAKVSGSRCSTETFFRGFLGGEVASMPRGLCLPEGMAAQPEKGLGSQDGEQNHLRERNLLPEPARFSSFGACGGTRC